MESAPLSANSVGSSDMQSAQYTRRLGAASETSATSRTKRKMRTPPPPITSLSSLLLQIHGNTLLAQSRTDRDDHEDKDHDDNCRQEQAIDALAPSPAPTDQQNTSAGNSCENSASTERQTFPNQARPGYTLSASGTMSCEVKVFVAEAHPLSWSLERVTWGKCSG